jgi:hypothetical protein
LSRNNQDRLSAHPAADPVPTTGPSEATFSFSTPTEFVELPTGGQYYPEGHPLHGASQVEIRYMTAKDEDILSSKTLLKKGLAIERFLQNIFVDRSIDTNTLYIGDKNAILVAARITGYGEEYRTRTTCPACTTTSDFSYDLSELSVYPGNEWEDFAIKKHSDDRFLITLPQTEVDVEVRLLASKDEIYLAKHLANKKKRGLPESSLTDQLRMLIVSVNGHTDSKSIQTFINGLPARDSRYLRTAYEKIVPNVDMTQTYNCDSCGFEQEVTVPFTADFFWPKR